MTPQMHADEALQAWQAMRGLPPNIRIERLMADFFLVPIESDVRYQDQLNVVALEMAS